MIKFQRIFRATGFSDEPFQLDLKDAELTPVSLHEQARSEVVVRDQPESLPLTSAPQAHSDESDAVAGSVAPPTSPQPRHSVEKKDEETSEFEEPPRRFGRTQRLRLLVQGRTRQTTRRSVAHAMRCLQNHSSQLAITALLALAQEFTEPKTFGDVKGLPDKAEWIAACHEGTAIWIEKSLGTVSARHASCGHSCAAVPMSLHLREDSMAQCGAKRDSLFVETTSGTWT